MPAIFDWIDFSSRIDNRSDSIDYFRKIETTNKDTDFVNLEWFGCGILVFLFLRPLENALDNLILFHFEKNVWSVGIDLKLFHILIRLPIPMVDILLTMRRYVPSVPSPWSKNLFVLVIFIFNKSDSWELSDLQLNWF